MKVDHSSRDHGSPEIVLLIRFKSNMENMSTRKCTLDEGLRLLARTRRTPLASCFTM